MEFGIGSLFCCEFFFTSRIYYDRLYSKHSEGLHYSNKYPGPLHYTIFGFCEVGGKLQQEWSMHVNEDGTSAIAPSKIREIDWQDIIYIFVRDFLSFYTLFYFIFFKG